MPNLSLPLDAASEPVPASTCRLYRGDCLDMMPRLEAKSIQMAFADLPYGTSALAWDLQISLQHFWRALRCLATDQAMYCLTATQPFATDLIASNRGQFKYDLIWNKARAANFGSMKVMPLRIHESVLIFAQTKVKYVAQKVQGKPTLRIKRGGKDAAHMGMAHRVGTKTGSAEGWRHPVSIIHAPLGRPQSSIHPTQKPVALLEWLIKTYTNEGDTILDPVFGSNTTGVACARLGRNYVGIEKDTEYFRIGTERVNAERAKLGLQPCEAIA